MTDKIKCYAVVALMCAWPLINFAIHNADLISESKEGILTISVVFISIVVFAYSLLYVLSKLFGNENQIRYALAGTSALLLFFSYPQIMRAWDYLFNSLNLSIPPHYGYGFTFILIPIIVMILGNHQILLRIAMVFSLSVVAVSLFELLSVSISSDAEKHETTNLSHKSNQTHGQSIVSGSSGDESRVESETNSLAISENRLNVYHIVSDEYARADQLASILDFDNSEFLSELKKRGYIAVSNARSNYPYTGFSLSSVFSMDYPYTESNSFAKFKKTYSIVGNVNPVIQKVWDLGYQYAHIGPSMWGGTQCPDHPRVICLTPRKAMISSRAIESLDAINRMTPLSYFVSIHAKVGGMTTVEDVHKAMMPKPVTAPFVLFAHTLPPHAPYTTRADCSEQPSVQFYLSGGLDPKKYLEALQCVNKRLLAFADYIAETDPNAIVVFHGDHGSKFLLEETLPLHSWTKKQFDERFSIFLAVKAPETCLSVLPSDLSLVNLYRFIFGCIEGEVPEYLENNFYNISYGVTDVDSRSHGRIYRFQFNDLRD